MIKFNKYLKEIGYTKKDFKLMPYGIINWFKYRRKNKKTGVSLPELWNLDITLAKIIYTYLRAFKDMKRYGYQPFNIEQLNEDKRLFEGGFQSCGEIDKNGYLVDSDKIWEDVIDKIILYFEVYLKCENGYYNDYLIEETKLNEVEEYKHLFMKYFGCLWD